jgi:ribosomal-protein-alanine N-acetyltransferase
MKSDMIVRAARAADFPSILSIETECRSVTWSSDGFQEELSGENPGALVAVKGNGEVVGFALARFAADECTIHSIAVSPSCQRLGVGRLLVNELAARAVRRGCTTMFLEVRSKNSGAQSFYGSLGFTGYAKRKAYYRDDNDDAMLMSLRLHLSV